jgi:hypothetical protein
VEKREGVGYEAKRKKKEKAVTIRSRKKISRNGNSILRVDVRQNISKKTGKLLTSRRYNHTPLLHSCPGGFSGSRPYKTCQGGKGK